MRLGEQLLSLAKAAGASLALAVQGQEVWVTPSTERDRLHRCDSCPELTQGPGGLSCAACGCKLPFKARVQAAVCPRGRWPQ